jgi:hypothetical protein
MNFNVVLPRCVLGEWMPDIKANACLKYIFFFGFFLIDLCFDLFVHFFNLQQEKQFKSIFVRSHIGSEHPEPGPYKCMLTLTSKTHFGAMRGCQEQTRKGDLGGSPGFRWIGRPKADNILLMGWGVTFGIRAEDGLS